MPLLNILALIIPALVGVLGGVVLGHRQVRTLREATGDDSAILRVLSVDVRPAQRHRERKAA